MIKPKGLKKGDRIGLLAPASPSPREDVEKARRALEDLGFQVVLGESCFESYGYLAGQDSLRARDLNLMFGRKDIDGIMALRGGYGSARILDKIDYDLIRENPKVFIGYSDLTALHTMINQRSDLVSYHGPMAVSDLIGDFSDFSMDSLRNSVFEGDYRPRLDNPEGEEILTINEGIAEGIVTGGNLSLLVSTIGTDYEIETEGKILLIEEVGEDPYSIDRMFTQLKQAGKFEGLKGIILGDFKNCRASKEEYEVQLPLLKLVEDSIKPLGIPTIYNFKTGHCEPKITLPLGIKVRLNASEAYVELLESPNNN